MNNKKQIIISSILGLCLIGGFAYAELTENEVQNTSFTPEIQNPKTDKSTSTLAYKFDIKTIKYFPEHIKTNTIMIPTLIGTTTVDVATTTFETIPSKYDFATTTHTKTISKSEYNYCRATKSEKTCKTEIERIVAESREYHLECAEAEMKSLQDELKRTDYWEELTTKK